MEVWKIIFLSKWVICRFHVNLPGCAPTKTPTKKPTYCWWLKSCTTWDVWNPINNGIFTISTGAGFQPSTVSLTQSPSPCGAIFCFSANFSSMAVPPSTGTRRRDGSAPAAVKRIHRWVSCSLGFQAPLKQWVFSYNHHCWTLRVFIIEIGSTIVLMLVEAQGVFVFGPTICWVKVKRNCGCLCWCFSSGWYTKQMQGETETNRKNKKWHLISISLDR